MSIILSTADECILLAMTEKKCKYISDLNSTIPADIIHAAFAAPGENFTDSLQRLLGKRYLISQIANQYEITEMGLDYANRLLSMNQRVGITKEMTDAHATLRSQANGGPLPKLVALKELDSLGHRGSHALHMLRNLWLKNLIGPTGSGIIVI